MVFFVLIAYFAAVAVVVLILGICFFQVIRFFVKMFIRMQENKVPTLNQRGLTDEEQST